MNYRALAAKENPFEGLSEQEAKKLIVYFNHFANPPMNDVMIYQRYGFVLPCGSMSMSEDMQLMMDVMQELTGC